MPVNKTAENVFGTMGEFLVALFVSKRVLTEHMDRYDILDWPADPPNMEELADKGHEGIVRNACVRACIYFFLLA
jgi:hypothetical protein